MTKRRSCRLTAEILNAMSDLIVLATAEDWSAARLDAELAKVVVVERRAA